MPDSTTSPMRSAVLAADGYSDLELWYPVLRLREAGAEVQILGREADDTVRSVLGYPVIPDRALEDLDGELDLVIVPGGAAAEALAGDPAAVALVARLAAAGTTLVTIGAGDRVAAAAGATPSATCADADGLPSLFRGLLETR